MGKDISGPRFSQYFFPMHGCLRRAFAQDLCGEEPRLKVDAGIHSNGAQKQ